MSNRIDELRQQLFINSPGDRLCEVISEELKKVSQWSRVFGTSIYPYKRMDFSLREFPGVRVYNDRVTKEFESWFVVGDVVLDMIFPASLRRDDLQLIQDISSHAMLMQFRRVGFFNSVLAKVPGLNELGKRFEVDKALGFEWGDQYVPLTRLTANFRLDLREWDLFMESDDRTVADPFERTLKDLETVATTLEGLKDDDQVQVTIPSEQSTIGD